MIDLEIIFWANIVCYAIYALDKYLAEHNKWRIPEFVLLLFSFLGGAFGALCAMIIFHHKTQNKVFKSCIPILLYIQLLIGILYRLGVVNI